MGRVYPSGGHMIMEDDAGHIIWATNLAPVNLLPDAYKIVLPNYEIAWADFGKNNAYAFETGTNTIGQQIASAASFATILPGEAPGAPIVLGTVPNGVNHLDVEINMYRSKAPTPYLGGPVPAAIEENKTILLDGGSCKVEEMGPWRRGFDITLSGNSIVLVTRQTVLYSGNLGIWTPGNQAVNDLGRKISGWTHGGRSDGYPAALLEAKGPTAPGGINKERGGSNQCSLGDNTDFSCRWRGAITITPGFIHP